MKEAVTMHVCRIFNRSRLFRPSFRGWKNVDTSVANIFDVPDSRSVEAILRDPVEEPHTEESDSGSSVS